MKIYFFGADYPPTGGGIATYGYELIHASSNHKDVSNINVLMFDNKNPRHEHIGDKIHLVTERGINFFYLGYRIFTEFISNRDFDIYHSLNLFPIGFWVVFWGKIFRKKTLITFYGTDANDASASRKTAYIKKWTLGNASSVITISRPMKEITESKYGFDKNLIKVIYPVMPHSLLEKSAINNNVEEEVNKIKERYGIDENTFCIVSVSRLVKRKGIEYMIRALNKIHDNNVKLFIIGEGKEKDHLIKLVNELNLNDRVFILGKVIDIIPYYKIASLASLVSYDIEGDGDYEGFGLVLVEAQSYGVPVLGTRSGGIIETFENNVTGILINPKDTNAIVDAIVRLKDDPELLNRLSKNTEKFLKDKFGTHNTIDKYIELCKSL